MTERFTGRTALVTGSTTGLGAAIATRLAAEGAFVVVSGRDERRGAEVVARIEKDGGAAVFVGADLSGGADVIRRFAADALDAAGGRIDILVNNAALLLAPTPTAEVAQETVDQALAVSVRSVFLLTGLLAPPMAERGQGAVVNLGSINGLRGAARSALYSMTKAAVHSLTTSWADEYGPYGVRVNTVAPGPTLTEKVAAMEEHLAPITTRTPARRGGTPAEVAAAVAFLVSDEASHVHGATLTVDGGYTAV
ncbi:SDR family oxidoreductase [Streptomyces sp. DSM 110735]|uniref:SDR family NAD(P)-dependent oxidoreductase n=1 Tax=Streptomyces sp. DSM 110735 TaxID=2775031 RepID=UPI0018F78C18|nr:SDR family oxidoreductase [Streptomyces sp. DSM 110735]MBJ7902226.1 SDR family oxidoreductase [Streptomyces sp. DSM 110735]